MLAGGPHGEFLLCSRATGNGKAIIARLSNVSWKNNVATGFEARDVRAHARKGNKALTKRSSSHNKKRRSGPAYDDLMAEPSSWGPDVGPAKAARDADDADNALPSRSRRGEASDTTRRSPAASAATGAQQQQPGSVFDGFYGFKDDAEKVDIDAVSWWQPGQGRDGSSGVRGVDGGERRRRQQQQQPYDRREQRRDGYERQDERGYRQRDGLQRRGGGAAGGQPLVAGRDYAISLPPSDEPLKAWQLEKLELAAVKGRRKVQISALAAELDMDRVSVIDWLKDFAARPDEERAPVVARRKAQLTQLAQQEADASAAAAVAASGGSSSDPADVDDGWGNRRASGPSASSSSSSSSSLGPDLGLNSPRAPPSGEGFIPYFERKQMGASHKKVLSAEALRTLESVYQRTPFPPNEVIKSLYDLHRISRDLALEWLVRRRAVDGIEGGTAGRRVKAERATAAPGSRREQRERNRDTWEYKRNGGGEDADEPAGDPQNELLKLFNSGAAAGGKPAGAAAAPQRVELSALEMARLRSALPSPAKRKGARAEVQAAIKSDPVTNEVEIGGVTYATRDGRKEWLKHWRRRRMSKGAPGRNLDFLQWYRSGEGSRSKAADDSPSAADGIAE